MTIRVEREALLMVINTSSSSSSSSSCSPCIRDDDDEFVIVDSVPTIKGKNNCFYSDYLASSYARDNDDQASLCTISTTSDSSFDSTSDISTIADHRRVSFAPQLVTDVWTRERTRLQDISDLYYSAQQTQTFRQEYRLERKVLSDLSIDPETFPVDDEELSNLVAATSSTNSSSSSNNNDRHRISRVVVLHNDKLATFFNPADQLYLPESNNNNREEKQQQQPAYSQYQAAESCDNLGSNFDDSDPSSSSEDFFDNDSFWSGSLTWY